jgi:hypothetical protein
MLSTKLVRLIEEHWDSITTRILGQIRHDPRLTHIASLPASDLRERARDILERLGHWLSASKPEELARRFERVGGLRYEEAIPLHEVVLSYLIIKDRMLEFVRDQGIAESPMALYAEEELQNCVGRFFDSMIYHMILGYEAAQDEAIRVRAHEKAKPVRAAG